MIDWALLTLLSASIGVIVLIAPSSGWSQTNGLRGTG
jgi:hypothetical protein